MNISSKRRKKKCKKVQFSLTHRTLNSSIHYTRSARSLQFIFCEQKKKMKKQQKMLWYSERAADKREWRGEREVTEKWANLWEMRKSRNNFVTVLVRNFVFLDRKAFNMKCAFSLLVKVLHSRCSQVLRVPLYGKFLFFL